MTNINPYYGESEVKIQEDPKVGQSPSYFYNYPTLNYPPSDVKDPNVNAQYDGYNQQSPQFIQQPAYFNQPPPQPPPIHPRRIVLINPKQPRRLLTWCPGCSCNT